MFRKDAKQHVGVFNEMNEPLSEKAELNLLARVGRRFGVEIIAATRNGGGFSGARVFRTVTADGREFAVRAGQTDKVRLYWLHRLLRFVEQQGVSEVPVPLLLKAEDDRTSLNGISADSIADLNGELWQVEPWMAGSPVDGIRLTQPQIDSAMQVVHRFHAAAADFAVQFDGNSWFQLRTAPSPAITRRCLLVEHLLRERLDQIERCLDQEPDRRYQSPGLKLCRILRRRVPALDRQLNSIRQQEFPLQPVIRDLWHAHLLFTEDRVTGLIDLTATGTDHVATDISRLSRSWFGADRGRAAALISSFERLRRLRPAEHRLLQILDECTVMLSPVTWLNRRYQASGPRGVLSESELERFDLLVETASAFEPLL